MLVFQGGRNAMDSPSTLWSRWHEQVKGLFPELHSHQQKTLALFVIGMVLSGCAVVQRVAEELSLRGINPAKMSSIERRLARFLANERIVVTQVWKQFLRHVLPAFRDKPLRFVLDMTPFNADATIIYIGLLVHSRLLPVAWCVMPNQQQWDTGQWEIVARLLDQIRAQLGPADCTLIADRGLVGAPLVKLCRERQWHYLLRVCKEHTCRRKLGRQKNWSGWCRFAHFIHKKGQQWYGWAQVWQEDTVETYVSACWNEEAGEAWLLISDRPAGRRRIHEYGLRMRVEATFQDSKSRGFNSEASQVKDLAHLDRLLLALFVAMWWLSHLAASCIHHGERERFDRHDRRDKSLFRLGRLWLLDVLRRVSNPATLSRCLPFRKHGSTWKFALRF
jgi:hypothetical protein